MVQDKERPWRPSEHYKDRAVAERYDAERFASIPGRLFNYLETRTILAAFRDLLPPGAVIADVPCGTGRVAEVLLRSGYRVVGVDISPAMLEVARRRLAPFGDRFEARVADVLDLDDGAWGDGACRFDGALCCRVLMHFSMAQQRDFLSNVASLTRGPVVFNHSRITAYQRLRRRAKRLLGHGAVDHPLSDSELSALITGAGLRENARRWVLAPLSEAAVFTCTHG
ncbi:MAG: class I SAM-dependent methyltransferase [Alphaproteobacteria bacterium]